MGEVAVGEALVGPVDWSMGLDPFSRRVFLRSLDDPFPTRYSSGSLRRAAALQRFVAGLQAVGGERLELPPQAELLVLNRHDWTSLFSYPYGLPFTRTKAGGAGVAVVAAADYPGKLLRRWDSVLLRAARCGRRPPSELPEFLDLLVGHEWGHAAANLSGLRARVKWFDEFLATYLFLAALADSDPPAGREMAARFVAWAEVAAAGSSVERADLGAFEYPLAKLGFDNLAWFQGVFTLFAWKLVQARGWDFPLEVRAGMSGLCKAPDRGELARLLVRLEPEFRRWFASFGPAGLVRQAQDC